MLENILNLSPLEEQMFFFNQLLKNRQCSDVVYICKKDKQTETWQQKKLTIKNILNKVNTKNVVADGEDVFITMNSFLPERRSRRSDNVSNLQSVFIDLDIYNGDKTANMGPLKAYEVLLNEKIQTNHIPEPSLVICSGQGLYLIWTIKNEKPEWKKVWGFIQKTLCSALASFGADSNALDDSRVLRIPGTLNTKTANATPVKVISYKKQINHQYELKTLYNWATGYTEKQYYLQIANAINFSFVTTPLWKAKEFLREQADKAKEKGIKIPVFPVIPEFKPCLAGETRLKITDTNFIADKKDTKPERISKAEGRTRAIYANRIEDIKTILISRGKNIIGYREKALHYIYCHLKWMGYSLEECYTELILINSAIAYPITDIEIKNCAMGSLLNYVPANETIIKHLNITAIEEQELVTIFSRKEKARRRVHKNKTGISRAERVECLKTEIKGRLDEGMCVSEIAASLQITAQTVRNYISKFALTAKDYIKNIKSEIKRVLKSSKFNNHRYEKELSHHRFLKIRENILLQSIQATKKLLSVFEKATNIRNPLLS